jgi:uncharacterized protein YecT (DUF1311 family)
MLGSLRRTLVVAVPAALAVAILAILTAASGAAPRAGAAATLQSCLQHANTTVDEETCISTALRTARRQLDAAYRALIARGVGDRRTLAVAERLWVGYTNADCRYAESLHAGGTLANVDVGLCEVRDTQARVTALRDYLGTR